MNELDDSDSQADLGSVQSAVAEENELNVIRRINSTS